MNKDNTVLYLSYDGILEPLGRSQVLAYLEKISSENQIYLISFEKKTDLQDSNLVKKIQAICLANDIVWNPLTYHKEPTFFATIFDILNGFLNSIFYVIKYSITVIHIRSYIPGLMICLLTALLNKKLIFDMRGFWADEKADRADWNRQGNTYRFFKGFEKFLLRQSDHIVCLTKESKAILSESYSIDLQKISVIPTCVDQSIFYPKEQQTNNLIVFGHLGSVDTAYDIDPILEYIKAISTTSKVRLDFINKGNHHFIKQRCEAHNLSRDLFTIQDSDRDNLSEILSKVDVGCFYAKENFSIKASMPTKIGEFLSCGKPILCNEFNEDIKDLILTNNVGILFDFQSSGIKNSCTDLLNLLKEPELSKRCQLLATNYFSLDKGVELYKEIYRSF